MLSLFVITAWTQYCCLLTKRNDSKLEKHALNTISKWINNLKKKNDNWSIH